MVSLLATETELKGIKLPEDVAKIAGLTQELWDRFHHGLGQPPSVRVLAMIPATVLQKIINSLRIPTGPAGADGAVPTREPNVTEVVQMALVWRVARQAVGLEDMDPMLPGQESSSAKGGKGTQVTQVQGTGSPTPSVVTTPHKKFKMSAVADQTDESEVIPKTRAEMTIYYENHREVTGSDPLPEVEPTDLQVAALEEKIVVRDEAPYADFAILTPFGRRMQKVMKTKSYSFQPDGSWKSVEIPGPPSFQAWIACFRVYRAVLFMLRYTGSVSPASGGVSKTGVKTTLPMVVQPHSLERYFEAFREMCLEFPEAWHLLMAAEDRMRGERFDHLRRQLTRAHQQGKTPVDVDYDPAVPWDGVFQAAAVDTAFWDANVRRPAIAFIARMGHQPQPALEPISEGARASISNVETAVGAKATPGPVSPRPKKRKRKAEEEASKQRGKGGGKTSTSVDEKFTNKEHPKKWGGLYHSTQDGKELCYGWAKGSSPDSCSDPCPNGRAHRCQICLGPHQNRECTKQPPKSKGKGTKK